VKKFIAHSIPSIFIFRSFSHDCKQLYTHSTRVISGVHLATMALGTVDNHGTPIDGTFELIDQILAVARDIPGTKRLQNDTFGGWRQKGLYLQ